MEAGVFEGFIIGGAAAVTLYIVEKIIIKPWYLKSKYDNKIANLWLLLRVKK